MADEPKKQGIATDGNNNALEAEKFFMERCARADDEAFLRILNREGGEQPRPEDVID
jgi:hypothetical protein